MKKTKRWQIIEEYLPNYTSRRDVLISDVYARFLDGEGISERDEIDIIRGRTKTQIRRAAADLGAVMYREASEIREEKRVALRGFNGYRSWNGWNVSVWISNSEHLYHAAVRALELARRDGIEDAATKLPEITPDELRYAVQLFFDHTGLKGERTPNGAIYNTISVYVVLQHISEDLDEARYYGNK